jgi:hypothetical protein
MKELILIFFVLFSSAFANAQAFARSWDAWFGQLQAGANTSDLKHFGPSYSLGIYKSKNNHGYGLDFTNVIFSDARLINGTISASQDLMRLRRNRRTPFYLYANAGIGLSHLRSTLVQDNFLLKGDDMVHVNVGLSPTYFFSRDFALQLKIQYQKMGLVDANIDQLISANLGIFFIIPALKP